MEATAASCPHCGYDWSTQQQSPGGAGWEYSALADIALMVAAVASGLGCIATLIFFLYSIANSHWLQAFVICPLAFLYQFGFVVAFTRIGGMRP